MVEAPLLESVRLPQLSQQSQLSSPQIFDINTLSDERTATIKRLLEKGHIAVAPLREPALILHSHLPHMLGSAYGLGAGSEQLTECYEHLVKSLKEVDETFIRGDKINNSDWRDFLQQKSYTVAYVEFFDEQVEKSGGDWESVLQQYLYSGPEPIINGFIGGLGHPFIHLAYAYEFRSKTVATEALSLGCTEYVKCHDLIDHIPPVKPTYTTTSLAEIVKRVQHDNRFDGIRESAGGVNFGLILQSQWKPLMEHWNAWEVSDLIREFEGACDLSVLLAIGTGYPDGKYDFFYAHIMTVAHALRILWQYFPENHRESILRQYALFVIMIFILQYRRPFGMEVIEAVEIAGHDWDSVREKSLKHKWALDEHVFKVVRALQEFEVAFGSKNGFYLKAAIKYLTDFNGWEGFGQGIMGYLPSRDGYIPA